jgi:hypothetical protein
MRKIVLHGYLLYFRTVVFGPQFLFLFQPVKRMKLKIAFTLNIGMLFSSTILSAQDEKKYSVGNEVFYPVEIQFLDRVLYISSYFLDSVQIIDSIQIKGIMKSFYQLSERIEVSKIEKCSTTQILDSLQGYELFYTLDYFDEHYYEMSFPGHSFAILRTFEYQDKWKNDIKTRNRSDCTVWKAEKFLLINYNESFLGQSYNRNSGITYCLMKK